MRTVNCNRTGTVVCVEPKADFTSLIKYDRMNNCE